MEGGGVSCVATGPSESGEAAPAQLDGTTLELPEGYYADLDTGKVDNDELFRREGDVGLRSLDLTAASGWEYRLRVGMQICVRSTRGKMFLLRVEEIPTYSTQPSVPVVQVA